MTFLEATLTKSFQLRFFFGMLEPARDGSWHKYHPLLPVRLTNGKLSLPGEVLCRFRAGHWEYEQPDEPYDESLDRQI